MPIAPFVNNYVQVDVCPSATPACETSGHALRNWFIVSSSLFWTLQDNLNGCFVLCATLAYR